MRSFVAMAVAFSAAVALTHTGRDVQRPEPAGAPEGAPAGGPEGRAQGRTARGAADGGTQRVRRTGPILLGTDPPGKLRPSREEADAGTPARVGGGSGSGSGSEEVKRELQQLRTRVDTLEQERSELQQQSQQLQSVVQELQQLRGQIAQGEQRRAAAEQREQAQRQQRDEGVTALQQAQEMLAGGNSSVEDQLSQAEASFPPQARKDLDYARAALRNRDLSTARMYLGTAIQHAQQGM